MSGTSLQVFRALFTAAVLAYTGAAAAEESRASEWSATLEALTDVPLQVGGRLAVEGPHGLRVTSALGYLPGPYVDLINDVVVAAGGYDETTASLVKQALQSSLVWRINAGWRPFSGRGFYFELGYALVTLGGGVSREDLVAESTRNSAPAGETAADRQYDVNSTLHMIAGEVGWEWVFGKALVLRTSVGGVATLAARTTVTPGFKPRTDRAVNEFATFSASYLDETYTSYVFSPTLTVSAGFRLF